MKFPASALPVLCVGLLSGSAVMADPAVVGQASKPAPKEFDVAAAAAKIDSLVEGMLTKQGQKPNEAIDDATFVRRAYLDIAGRVPTIEEAENFHGSDYPRKRQQLITDLLESEGHMSHAYNYWADVLRINSALGIGAGQAEAAYQLWVKDAIRNNKPYDQFVRDIVTASGEAGGNPATIWYRQVVDTNQQVEDLSQLFLGLRLQCARCHHHPFEKWSTADYYQLSAFFSRIGRKKGAQPGEDQIFHNRGPAQAAGPKATHQAAVLGGTPAELAADVDPRTALVDWMTTRDNPFFARSIVNRYWKHFFSRGLVEPEDDMRLTNPPTNPALLDALAADFVEHGYDLKHLVRTICRSNTYQLSAEPNEFNAEDRQSFSRFYPRRLPAEVALDAIDTLTGKQTAFGGTLAGTRSIQLPDPNFGNYFLTVFGRPNGDSACECERVSEANLAQSIHLINSADILGKLGGDGRASKLVADQGRDDAAKVAELYLVSFSRPPSAEENGLVQKYLEGHGDNRQAAYEDVIWSLLNTKDFLFNH